MVGKHQPGKPQERRRARDGAEIVRVGHPVQDRQQPRRRRPPRGFRRIEGANRLRPRHRDDAAVHGRPGDAGELLGRGFTEHPARLGQHPAVADGFLLHLAAEEKPLDPVRRMGEERFDRFTASDADEIALMDEFVAARAMGPAAPPAAAAFFARPIFAAAGTKILAKTAFGRAPLEFAEGALGTAAGFAGFAVASGLARAARPVFLFARAPR